jgi:hypothetical protein
MVRAWSALLLLFAALFAASAAAAEPPRPPVQSATLPPAAQAESLFEQGRKLAGQGRHAEACPYFAESERLDHGVGTLLNLAECHEKSGLLATAWAEYRRSAAEAGALGQVDRAQIAREREIALQPLLTHLALTLPPQGLPPGAEVHRDGVLVSPWLWSSPYPVEPGDHAVLVAAPGKIDYSTTVRVPRQHVTTFVARIPPLKPRPAPAPKAAAAVVSEPPPPRHPRATAGLILVGVSGAGALVGALFGVHALGLKGDSVGHCNELDRCDDEGTSLRAQAVSSGTASTIAFFAAGAALAGGLVLYATAPSVKGPRASFGVAGGTARVAVEATW